MSFIKFSFSLITFVTVFIGFLLQKLERILPPFISQLYRYGKMSYEGTSQFHTFRVPKRWFQHFYVFSSVWSTLALILIVYVNILEFPLPETISMFFDLVGGDERDAKVSATSTFIAGTLMTLQCYRRFYETHFVSVFSKSYMDIGHYLLGLFHYFGAILAIILESPGFTNSPGEFESKFSLCRIRYVDLCASLVFMFAWLKQLECAKILANLRRNKKGEVVTEKHLIPQGGLFDKVSSPHLSCEILMYISLTVILFGNRTWLYIIFWVFSNQVSVAILTHQWYNLNFKNYPKNRKILIPGIW